MGSTSSRLICGNFGAYCDAEIIISGEYGRPCLIFNGGYHANTGILPAVAGEGDFIACDRLAHASIIDALSLGRAKSFETPLGYFDYVQITQTPLFSGVERIEDTSSMQSFLVAKPLKAIADYVASHGMDWRDSEPLEESLRIEHENIVTFTAADFDELDGVYKSRRARLFLSGLRKELGR